MTGSVTDRDRGYRALFQRLAMKNQGRVVDVGVTEKSGAVPHGDSGLSVSDVANIQEFGLGVPERSFIRAYVDENLEMIEDKIRRMAIRVIVGDIRTFDQGLELIGRDIERNIKARIRAGIGEPNNPDTAEEKGSATPLIDSEQLFNAIVYELKSVAS